MKVVAFDQHAQALGIVIERVAHPVVVCGAALLLRPASAAFAVTSRLDRPDVDLRGIA